MLSVDHLGCLHLGPVEFSIGNGECVAVTGPSGSGKSVLLRAIVDLEPNTGNVSTQSIIRAETSSSLWRKAVSMLPAESGWWSDHVSDHFHHPDIISPFLETIRLAPEALSWRVARLSTGEKHRLALLRCLEHNPQVLLLDEPTAALDHDTTLCVEALLKRLMAKGTSILIVTHNDAQAQRLADRILHLEGGQLNTVTE